MQLRRQRWLAIFNHPSAVLTVGLITIHQAIIATSSYFLTRLIEVFQQGGDYQEYLFLYLAAMLVPYIPGCISFFTLQVWINQAHQKLTNRLATTAYGLTEKYREAAIREIVESVAARNSFITIKDYLNFVHGFLGFLLNSSLSMLVLGFLLPGNLLAGYIVSLVLCSSIIILMKKSISSRSAKLELRFISYSESLSAIWDNTTLGNKCNFDQWLKIRDSAAEKYYRESNELQFFKQIGNLLLAAAALGPTIYLVAHAVQDNSAAPALIAAIVVNLTRVFHILNSLSSLVYQLLDWTSMNARLKVLFDAEQRLSDEVKLPTASSGDLNLNQVPVKKFDDIVSSIRNESRGRFTIRGGNGVGKSTLLLILKKALANDAILIPAHHGKLCWESSGGNMSTGQKTLAQLQEVSGKQNIKYLLLDEWDANLDIKNTLNINQILEELSHEKVVLEIRH